jgi:hypothetical protein
MKKIVIFVSLLTCWTFAVFTGCNQVDFEENPVANRVEEAIFCDSIFNVSIGEVRCLVNILNKDNPDDFKKEVSEIQPIAYQGDTLLYIVNYQDNKGWLVISGDKRTTNVLAYGDIGDFNLNAINPGVGIWTEDLAGQIYALKHRETIASDTLLENFILWQKIDEYMRYLQSQSQPQLRAVIANTGYWECYDIVPESFTTTTEGPLLTTKWGQDEPWADCVPYNKDYTGKCPTGCEAVAGAQMLYYLLSCQFWNNGIYSYLCRKTLWEKYFTESL